MSGRPAQVGIERLPARRMSNEPRESMNYKVQSVATDLRSLSSLPMPLYLWWGISFRKLESFGPNSFSIDAVPKKRGPKTDVLEALLKRVDGLERKLRDEKKSNSPNNDGSGSGGGEEESPKDDVKQKRPHLETPASNIADESAVYSPTSIRYTSHPNGYFAAVRLSEDYAHRARTEVDIDEPSIDTLQALLLLAISYTASGRGKKAYMMFANAIGMAVALELHRELDQTLRISPVERELRRRLFWTCYLMDRFTACGSKRPSLIGDKSILLRLPSWSPNSATLAVQGEFFQSGSNLHFGSGKKSQGSSGMLIDIVRILGITNRYLAAGGVKGRFCNYHPSSSTIHYMNTNCRVVKTGDSHFPWHSLSNLSKIRQDLDIWAGGTQDVFTSVDTLFGQPDSTTLVLSKLIYHLIHCLIYRPFLPIDLAELAGTGQHQSWQIEATNLCFLHANAIAELVELGKQSASIEWPDFVGYCICTAATVHVHGTHYKGAREGEVFSASADFLSREMQQLSELRYAWSSVQHQRETLQTIYGCHSELVKSLGSNPMRFSPVFHLEDFFDRYSDLGQYFDGAHISFSDVVAPSPEAYQGHDLYAPTRANRNGSMSARAGSNGSNDSGAVAVKRKSPSSARKRALTNSLKDRPLMSPNGPNGRSVEQLPLPQNGLLGHDTASYSNDRSSIPTLSQIPFSPPSQNQPQSYNFSPSLSLNHGQESNFEPMFGMPHLGGGGNFSFGGMGGTNGGMMGEEECGRKDENEFAQTRQRQKKGLQDIHKGGGERPAAEIRGWTGF
ncbi:hypothetical protein SS1G_04846 [Sclerotinia sclerotiorum 1980 UF-70]|uniref:Xylanolytic transcriptional activator regulatory domain-containing protein n=1 Tax=Sclerotinia sclerotiorum (strain ATCC 18683 / 1980 / Ss-1) TaxID=665079 RepID=A7EHQ4_SCLS1|nr:hypothetical protein SS1G_04846 [Sclerotinia sclerotiorum 1980 UF-70]EDO02370.1 hypothetical protein SS1G_04846 [Sclerotinia sclerotiorum 1980 UF-70]